MGQKFAVFMAGVMVLANVSGASADSRTDRELFDAVGRAVTGYAQFTIFDDIALDVKDGTVVLEGNVTMPYKRDEIGQRVAEVEGVRSVRNDIRVLPVSTSDDRLRYRIARAIYDNPHFWNYAIGPNPPIHIIVEHGRVTLTGVVNNDLDRLIARSLAHQFPALSVTDNLKTNAEVLNQLETIE